MAGFAYPTPILTFPLSGKVRVALRAVTWPTPTSVLPLRGRMKSENMERWPTPIPAFPLRGKVRLARGSDMGVVLR